MVRYRENGLGPEQSGFQRCRSRGSGAAPRAEALLEQAQDRARLYGCLEELDARTRQAIRTAFFEGVTYEALAVRLDAPLGTVKSWIRRGLIRLKGCLET